MFDGNRQSEASNVRSTISSAPPSVTGDVAVCEVHVRGTEGHQAAAAAAPASERAPLVRLYASRSLITQKLQSWRQQTGQCAYR